MATRKTETRSFEVRAAADDDFALTGYAALFNSGKQRPWRIHRNDCARRVRPFAGGQGRSEIYFSITALNKMLARTKNAFALCCPQTTDGLKFHAQLDKGSPLHVEIYRAVKSGALPDECSFAFCVGPEGQVWNSERTKRTLTDVELLDCAVVSNPAYEGTSVDARDLRAITDTAELLARVAAMPGEWARQERIHQANLAVLARRSDTDDSEPEDEGDYTDEMQKAIHERFGSTRSGAHPAHFLVRYDSKRCYTRHLDSDTRCKFTYQRDDSDESYDFGDVEPDSDYAGEIGDRSQIALDDERLRIRCAIAAGRTR